MISIDNISVHFGGFTLLDKVSFLITPKDKIGLIGKNGAGKSTLLKMIANEQNPSEGAITKPTDCTIGYLPQQIQLKGNATILEETNKAFNTINQLKKQIDTWTNELAERTDYESKEYAQLIDNLSIANEQYNLHGGQQVTGGAERALIGLGFERPDFERPCSEFSGGWRMRVELAKILLQEPDVILLDEPTNHLDIESIQWLENFLKNYSGAVVLVSHDRAFLDNVTNRTIEIVLGKAHDYRTNYSHYLELRKERKEQQIRAHQNQQKLIKDTEDFIEKFRYKATKSNQVQSRIKQLEKLDRIEIDEEDSAMLNLKFPPAPHSGITIIEAENYSLGYGDSYVLKNIDFNIERGEKVAFVGRNGEGKSTLVKAIIGELNGVGKFKTGHQVSLGYFAQNQAQLMDDNLTVFQTIDNVAKGDIRTKIRNILGAFMFGGDTIEKKVKVLSGGERTRLAMIKLLLEPVNVLVLDEPTNHLDINSKEVLKEAIKSFNGTAIIVSHDRDFLDGLVNKTYEFRHGGIKEHLGGIYDFLHKKNIENLQQLEFKSHANSKKSGPNNEEEKNSNLNYTERKELNKKLRYAERDFEKIEKDITEQEDKMAILERQLANATENIGELYAEYETLKEGLDNLIDQWEKANEKIEELKQKIN